MKNSGDGMKYYVQIPSIVFIVYLFSHFVSFAAISETEHLRYVIKINGKSYEEKMVVHRSKDLIQYESCGNYTNPKIYAPGGHHCWDVVSTYDGQPRLINYHVGPNNMQMIFDKNGLFEMKGVWDGKNCHQKMNFDNQVYVEINSLVRTMNLNSKTPITFDLVRITAFPMVKSHDLFFQILHDIVIDVPAGRFNCKKVMLSATGYKGYFFKAFFYVTNDENQFIVRVDNIPIGGMTQLIEVSF
jgi:hypothetical protein